MPFDTATEATPQIEARPLDRSLYRLILRHSLHDQLQVGSLTLVSLPFYYLSLELPKTIINAINGRGVPATLLGRDISQTGYLFTLCAALLFLVIVNGGFKYAINLLKGRAGERMLRRLRFRLFHQVLRFPPAQFKRISAGELIPMITAEVEPLGGFIGDAFALPGQQGGMLLTAVLFMFAQDVVLGFAAIAFYPLQFWLIPRLQAKVNRLDRERIRGLRVLGDRTGETVAGLADLRAGDGIPGRLADIDRRLDALYRIRYAIFRWKFLAQELNQVLGQLTPFFFFAVGGYLVLRGQLSFGALVAVLSAYRDLAPPWEELLEFYQSAEDVRIKYEQIVEQFEPPGLTDPVLQLSEPEPLPVLAGGVVVEGLCTADRSAGPLLHEVGFSLVPGEIVAVIGDSASGKSVLAQALARLVPASAGRILLDGTDLASLPYAVSGRRIAYVPPAATPLSGTLGEALLGGLRQRPFGLSARPRDREALERKRSGNSPDALDLDWTDRHRAGVADQAALEHRLIEVLDLVDLSEDVFRFGLAAKPGAVDTTRLLAARRGFAEALAAQGLAGQVETFDPGHYVDGLSIAENILFGTPIGRALSPRHLPDLPYMRQLIERQGLAGEFVRLGRQIAETLIELFGDLPAEPDLFARFDGVTWEELPELRAILTRAARLGLHQLGTADRARLTALAYFLIEPRHRLGLLTEPLKARLVEARGAFAIGLPAELRPAVEFYDPNRVSEAACFADNILFGSIRPGTAAAPIHALLTETLERLGLHAAVILAGLGHPIGSGGSRLTPVQRQKLAIGRALMKRPAVLILNEAGAILDAGSQSRLLAGIRQEFAGRTVLTFLQRAAFCASFDRVLVLRNGRLVEDGSPAELDQPDSEFRRLTSAG
ncbi:MAG: ABC transporter transmembrane domain-containing protein [Aliidongia sp.]